MKVLPVYPGLSPGHPLDMLGEEACELAQAIFKHARFGADGAKDFGYTGPTPLEQIHQEMGDLLAVYDIACRQGFIDPIEVGKAVRNKHAKLYDLFGFPPTEKE